LRAAQDIRQYLHLQISPARFGPFYSTLVLAADRHHEYTIMIREDEPTGVIDSCL
jgi:hypothetical protein